MSHPEAISTISFTNWFGSRAPGMLRYDRLFLLEPAEQVIERRESSCRGRIQAFGCGLNHWLPLLSELLE